MLLGTSNLLPSVKGLNRPLNDFSLFLICQVLEGVDLLANPVFKNPGILVNCNIQVYISTNFQYYQEQYCSK